MEQSILNEILVTVKRTESEVKELAKRIGALEERVGALEERVGALEERVGALEERVSTLEAEFATFKENIKDDMNVLKEVIKQEIATDVGKTLNEIMIVVAKVGNQKQEEISNKIDEHERRAIKGVELLKQSLEC